MSTSSGGDKLAARLQEISRKLTNASAVRVGFLSESSYPDGKPVAFVAALQEWGAPAAGIPARPFFRNMIATKKAEWPNAMAGLLKANDYDALRTLQQTGEAVSGQLKQSIIDTNEPALAPSTIKRKGFSKPLVDTGHMLNSVNYEVKE